MSEVNGLNVTECTHLSDSVLCDYTENHSQFCSDYENCYFKQLQRLKAENERLSELTCVNCGEKFLSPTGSELYEENVQLKEEKEKLLKELQYRYEEMNTKGFLLMGETIEYWKNLKIANEKLKRDKKYRLEAIHNLNNKVKILTAAINKPICFPDLDELEVINKYKQALEEVREIAKLCLNRSDCFNCPNYDKCEFEDAEIPTHDVCKPIIPKINEVLKDE